MAARRTATEGLTLARQTGMPYAVIHNLLALAHAIAPTDPDEARALLTEALEAATTLGYESPSGLMISAFTAARLQERPAMLRAASRVMHHSTRTGAFDLTNLAAILNLVARALSEPQPETAAVLQGTVRAMLERLVPDIAGPISGTAGHNEVAAFVTEVRRDTTQLLTTALGELRLRELRGEGAAMDETQACNYARAHIDEYLATLTHAAA